jgi:hypothetical protein
MKSIYELKFGESLSRGNWEVMRVPGGWLWIAKFNDFIVWQKGLKKFLTHNMTTTFVPFNSEFDDRLIEPTPTPSSGD